MRASDVKFIWRITPAGPNEANFGVVITPAGPNEANFGVVIRGGGVHYRRWKDTAQIRS